MDSKWSRVFDYSTIALAIAIVTIIFWQIYTYFGGDIKELLVNNNMRIICHDEQYAPVLSLLVSRTPQLDPESTKIEIDLGSTGKIWVERKDCVFIPEPH